MLEQFTGVVTMFLGYFSWKMIHLYVDTRKPHKCLLNLKIIIIHHLCATTKKDFYTIYVSTHEQAI